MKQELIANFLIQKSSRLSIEDTMHIQNLLKTTLDEAYPILMAAKIHVNPWKVILYIISAGLFLIFCWGFYETVFDSYHFYWEDFLIAVLFLIGAIPPFIGAICIKSKKKRMLENYLRIILAYQKS